MNVLLVAAWLLAGGLPAADTLVDLRRGDRVVVERVSGELVVETWDRAALEIRGEDRDPVGVSVSRSGNRVVLRTVDRKGRGFEVEAVLRIPEWVDLEIQGRSVDVRVSGTRSSVQVRNVSGDIRVDEAVGALTLSSVEGEIYVDGVRGSVTARSRGDEVTLLNVVGAVDAESGSGDVRLVGIDGASVRAKTMSGDVFFSGPLTPGGSYWFWVHDGDADLELSADASAHVSVSTFDGEFTSDFPVLIQRYEGGGVFDFMLGDGEARLEIQVFDGEIRLHRRGER